MTLSKVTLSNILRRVEKHHLWAQNSILFADSREHSQRKNAFWLLFSILPGKQVLLNPHGHLINCRNQWDTPLENPRPAGDDVCACRWQGPYQHWSILSPGDQSRLINQRQGSVTDSNVTSSIIKTLIKPPLTHWLCSAPRQSLSSLHPPPALLLSAPPHMWNRILKCLARPASL